VRVSDEVGDVLPFEVSRNSKGGILLEGPGVNIIAYRERQPGEQRVRTDLGLLIEIEGAGLSRSANGLDVVEQVRTAVENRFFGGENLRNAIGRDTFPGPTRSRG
jgi:hypothetical protein